MKPLISVIIPAYNAYHTLIRSVESVRTQTYEHKEIILVDDGSTDNTDQLIMSTYPDITYIKISHTGFPGLVRNEGIRRASGTFLAFLDADDYWDSDVLTELADCFVQNQKIGLAYGSLMYVGGKFDGKYIQDFRTPLSGRVFEEMIECNFIPMHPVLVKKDIMDYVGGFDTTMHIAEDYDLWLRITALYPVAYTVRACGYYCVSTTSTFQQSDLFERNLYLYKIIKKIHLNYTVNSIVLWKRLAVICLTLCNLAVQQGRVKQTIKYALFTVWFSMHYYCKRLI